jgi:hypothetical protein
MLSLKEKR